MTAPHHGRLRVALASGALLGVAALTAAAFTDHADVHVAIDGSANRFDLVAAGSSEPGWTPSDASWVQANPNAYTIDLTPDGSPPVLGPGGTIHVRVAARNASPRLAGELSLTILDPDPLGDATDPVTGRYTELWDQLVFTVTQGNTVIFDQVHAADLSRHTWPASLAPGDYELLDVAIHLPYEVDNRWQEASTDIQFHFEAVNT